MYSIHHIDECHESHALLVNEERKYDWVPSFHVCIALCIREKNFICRSVDIYGIECDDSSAKDNTCGCKLYKENKFTDPDRYIVKPAVSDKGYYKYHCTVGRICNLSVQYKC